MSYPPRFNIRSFNLETTTTIEGVGNMVVIRTLTVFTKNLSMRESNGSSESWKQLSMIGTRAANRSTQRPGAPPSNQER
jgi:hypothetical protein